jgi:transketolase
MGLDGRVVSVDESGESASGPDVLRRRGIHLDEVTAAAQGPLAGTPATPPGSPELATNQGRTS